MDYTTEGHLAVPNDTEENRSDPPNALPAELFAREDESPDEAFYQQPRLTTHIDDATIAALTRFYESFLPAHSDVLDLMSSWISHLPDSPYGKVAGLGMNEQELEKNPRLTEHCVRNLNASPELPYPDRSFDRAMIVVSIQYLKAPVPVLAEVRRTLRGDGQICIAMSHRLFPTKAIAAFRHLAPADRIALVQQYLVLAGYSSSQFIDASPGGSADPLWLVVGKV